MAQLDPPTDARAADDPDIASDFVHLDGVRLHVASAGSGPPMVFLHGFPEFWYGWHRQLRTFKNRWHAIAPDMRGYNLSSKPGAVEDYRMRHLVNDVAGLARHLGGRKLVLVGHDWGGAVAWATAIRHPELIERLIIVNAPHPLLFSRLLAGDPAQAKASRYMTAFNRPDTEAKLAEEDFTRLMLSFSDDGATEPPMSARDQSLYKAAWRKPGALTAMLNYYRNQSRAGGLPGNEADFRVRVPTLVLWGERDRYLLPANLDGMDALVPGVEIMRLPTATHWVVHEQSDTVNAAIAAFVSTNS